MGPAKTAGECQAGAGWVGGSPSLSQAASPRGPDLHSSDRHAWWDQILSHWKTLRKN